MSNVKSYFGVPSVERLKKVAGQISLNTMASPACNCNCNCNCNCRCNCKLNKTERKTKTYFGIPAQKWLLQIVGHVGFEARMSVNCTSGCLPPVCISRKPGIPIHTTPLLQKVPFGDVTFIKSIFV